MRFVLYVRADICYNVIMNNENERIEYDRIYDVAAGCLIGGAVGDALGYPVEFFSLDRIKAEYGEGGITRLALKDGNALVSDDTQMTLFTAEAVLLYADGRGALEECGAAAYDDWLVTQRVYAPVKGNTPLSLSPRMYARREPGNTCLSALESVVVGALDKPINDSKGCGGVMRVAPCGIAAKLFGGADGAATAGAKFAAITHGHPLGWLPSAQLAYIVACAALGKSDLGAAIEASRAAMPRLFGEGRHTLKLDALIGMACDLASGNISDEEAIALLGRGWVGDEALAIAVYCALKHERKPYDALIAAVNHSGDSDSTGAITGNIVGAFYGEDSWLDDDVRALDVKEEIADVAGRLARVSA